MAVKGRKRALNIFGDAMSTVVEIYILLILTVMPFYFTDGYGRIGTNKYQFFHGVTIAMGVIFLVVCVFAILTDGCAKIGKPKGRKKTDKATVLLWIRKNISLTDRFAVLYGVALILSYLHTAYKADTPYGNAWAGSNGWYMGFSTQMMFLAIYFVISRCWNPKKWIIGTGVAASLCVFLLGYLNRFSVYPIKMAYANASFISTIGNINWFCGYAVTVFFGVLYYWWADREKKAWAKSVLAVYSVAGFGALTTQGSSSGLLALMILCVTFYLLSAQNGEKMQRFWLMMILLGATCTATVLLRYTLGDRFQHKDALTDIFTHSIFPAVVLVISVVMFVLVCGWNRKGNYPQKAFIWVGKAGLAAGVLIFVFVVAGILINTLAPGSLGKLSEVSIFTFNEGWGSHRGATYMAGVQTWLDQDLWGKLLGVGPDCMAMYIHGGSNQEMLSMVHRIWGESTMLTNAHCEWLTIMVNVGVLGVIGFAGMISSAVVRFIKAGNTNVIAAACGMSILAYTLNNVVSFQQAMSTSTMFVILGIGEACMRKDNDCK